MCGIGAIISKENFIQMLSIYMMNIKHRGPDSTVTKQFNNVYMCFHRLAIIDPSEKSNQPFSIDGIHLICNGEIFNYKELIKTHGLRCRTESDCEVILHLYRLYGITNTITLLDGEFSFILYDQNLNLIYAVRDRFGVRPLFIDRTNDYIILASEAKAMPTSDITTIQPFLPGHCAIINPSDLSCNMFKYGKNLLSFSQYNTSTLDINSKINLLFTEAVKKRLVSDRPIGCLLSGGVDSSLVTSIASRYIEDLHCFSIGLDKDSMDIVAAKKVADYLGIKNHHIITFTVEEGFGVLEQVIYALESYDVTTIRASIPQYLMAKYISENTDIKVILSGEGSDELFAGYRYNRNAPTAIDLNIDNVRLLEELYMFDNLRTDRTTANWGLEVRVPFLDSKIVEYVLSTDPVHRLHKGNMEKSILRDSFKTGYLPDDILYRPKEAFSDAVSNKEVSWYKSLQNIIDKQISDSEFNDEKNNYLHNPPLTKEGLYYRKIFNKYFNNGDHLITHYWMPKWQGKDIVDPSATILNCYLPEDKLRNLQES